MTADTLAYRASLVFIVAVAFSSGIVAILAAVMRH
jgi:hypothetical protein